MAQVGTLVFAALMLFGAVSYIDASMKFDNDAVCDGKKTPEERNVCRFAMSGAGY